MAVSEYLPHTSSPRHPPLNTLAHARALGIWLQAAYNSFRTPLIFSATIVIILMTCVLMLAVNASERILLGPPGDDEDPDADQ